MAIDVKQFEFTANTSTGTQQIASGLGFTPKSYILISVLNSSLTTFQDHHALVYGFSDGSTDACCAVLSEDNQASSDAGKHAAGTVIRIPSTTSPDSATNGIAAHSSFGSGTITINWTEAPDTAYRFIGIAFGGSGLSTKVVRTTATASSTGNQAYTGAGFQPKFAISLYPEDNFSLPGQSSHGSLGIGAMLSTSKRFLLSITSEDGRPTMDTWRYQDSTHCTGCLNDSTGTSTGGGRADFVSWDSDGVTLNWTAAPSSSSNHLFFLFFGGDGDWDLGKVTKRTTTGTTEISPSSNTIEGIMLFSNNKEESTATQVDLDISLGLATGTGATDQGGVWSGDQDDAADSETAKYTDDSNALVFGTPNATASSSSLDVVASISAMSTTFTLNYTATTTSFDEIFWVTVGETGTTTVTANRTHKYNIIGKLTTTRTHKYNIEQTITATRTHKYNLLNAVSATRTHKFNLLELVSALRTHKYDIIGLVQALRTHKYNILEAVLATRTHKYNIIGLVTALRTHKYNITGLVTALRTHKYDMEGKVTALRTHKYNILELVTALRTHKYNILELVQALRTHKYNIEQLVTALRTHKYDLEGKVTTTRTHKYNILEAVIATRTHKYNILALVSALRTHKYNIIGLVTALRTHKYHLEGLVTALRTHKFNILNTVTATRTHKYNILQTVTKTTTHKYNIIGLVTALRTHKYDVSSALSTVTATRTHLYNIIGKLTTTRTHLYNVLNTLTTTRTHKFTLLNSVSATRTHKYDITALVQALRTHKYDMGGQITTTRTHKFDVQSQALPAGSGGSTNVFYYFPRKPKEIIDIIPADLQNTVTADILVFEPYYRIFVDADIQYIQNVDNKQIARTASRLGLDVTDALGLQPNLLIASVQAGSGYQQENKALAAVEQSSYVTLKTASNYANTTANIQLISKSNHSAKALIESCKDPIFTTSHIETTKSQYHSVINTKMMLTAEAERYQLLIKILQSEVFD